MRGEGRRGRSLLLLFPLLIFPALAARPAAEPWTVLLTGDADGYLSPCGCTSPMQGGLKRRATALRGEGNLVRLDNGGLAKALDRQSVLKAETGAAAIRTMGIDASNFTGRDAALGAGETLTLARLAGDRLVSTSLQPSATVSIKPWRVAGPFLVGGATAQTRPLAQGLGEAVLTPEAAAHRLAEEAASEGRAPVLLFDGDRLAAAALARAEPALRLVTYRATGKPVGDLEFAGACALASPGESGKAVVRLAFRDGAFAPSQKIETLGPEVTDDPSAKRLYDDYLRQVTREKLLDKTPHVSAGAYAGSARCGACHAPTYAVWKASAHAHALRTLEDQGNGRDPDCVKCHVVAHPDALAFVSRKATPSLANVGCESCHGAGAAHAASPWKARLPRIGEAACLPCHTLENSPRFDFAQYWPKIRHGGRLTKTRGKPEENR